MPGGGVGGSPCKAAQRGPHVGWQGDMLCAQRGPLPGRTATHRSTRAGKAPGAAHAVPGSVPPTLA